MVWWLGSVMLSWGQWDNLWKAKGKKGWEAEEVAQKGIRLPGGKGEVWEVD